MATPSHNNSRSWANLTASARKAPVPEDIDLCASIRAEISSGIVVASGKNESGIADELLGIFGLRSLRLAMVALAAGAVLVCSDAIEIVNQLAFLWELQGPVISGI